eukprot:7022988-Prymnesium_polylepis.1
MVVPNILSSIAAHIATAKHKSKLKLFNAKKTEDIELMCRWASTSRRTRTRRARMSTPTRSSSASALSRRSSRPASRCSSSTSCAACWSGRVTQLVMCRRCA